MSDRPGSIFLTAIPIVVFVVYGFVFYGVYSDCHQRKGALVEGVSWSGYVCVQGVK